MRFKSSIETIERDIHISAFEMRSCNLELICRCILHIYITICFSLSFP